MHLRRMIPYPFIALTILASTAICNAQNVSWVQRSWQGRAYILGNDPKNYDLVLTIKSVKGKNLRVL